jgi:hypothetical protein
MRDPNPSEDPAAPPAESPARAGALAPDLLTGVGVLSAAAGAGTFHVGAGLIVFGLALILIGARGAAATGA